MTKLFSAKRDPALLFASRFLRMFAFGLLAVVLAIYLETIGFDRTKIGFLFSLTLVGDTVISLLLTARADRFGRRRTLAIGAALMLAASVVFASTTQFVPLVIAATLGVLSPSGNEIGPFLSIEQAALAEEAHAETRVGLFAWYNLTGYFAAALGALSGGTGVAALHRIGISGSDAFRVVIIGHGLVGLVMLGLYLLLTDRAETHSTSVPTALGLTRSRKTVFRLAALFSVDAFAGGFVMQSLIAYWFHLRWHAGEEQIGAILFAGNLLSGVSALLASRLARRFGLVNTMVWTHLPSNVLLLAVPFMPTLGSAMGVLLGRYCLSQMDVPTRQAYVVSVVSPEERSAAGGVTNVARSVGVSVSPLFLGLAFASPVAGVPFLVAGTLKIAYDLALWRLCAVKDGDVPPT